MNAERRERDERALLKSLSSLAKRSAELSALESYFVDEFARFLAYGCDEKEEFTDFYRQMRGEISIFDKDKSMLALVFDRLCHYLRERGAELKIGDFFDTEPQGENEVTYVKNPMADEACRVFSAVLGNPVVTYAPSFVSACEDVYYGRVPFCILPFESSEQGALTGFTRLTRKYELYPHLVCSCRSENGVTRLALFGRDPCVREESKHKMMLRALFYGGGRVISDVIAVATSLGLTLIKTESEAVPWDEGRYGEIITFGADTENVLPFLLYLELEAPECSDKSVFYEVENRL